MIPSLEKNKEISTEILTSSELFNHKQPNKKELQFSVANIALMSYTLNLESSFFSLNF